MSLDIQVQLLIRFILFGFYIGLTYDFINYIIIKKINFPVFKIILSLLFWIFTSFTFYNYIYPLNYYVLPIYSLPIMGTAVILYSLFFRSSFLKSLVFINSSLSRLYKYFILLLKFSITSPIIVLTDLVKYICLFIGKHLKTIYTNTLGQRLKKKRGNENE